MPRALIVAETFARCSGDQVSILEQGGFTVEPLPEGCAPRDTAALSQCVQGFHAVLAGSEPYPRTLIAGAPGLRAIVRVGVGYDGVDVEAATAHGVAVTIAPGTNDQAVAEHTIAMILCVGRRLLARDRQVRSGAWPRVPMLPPVRSRTLGIVGLGRIGQEVARCARALGMVVIAFEPFPDLAFTQRYGVELAPLDELLARSDYVTLHLPLTGETAGLIDRARLSRMKAGSVLINTARGGLVVEADLVEALQRGHLGGAALDVLQREPPGIDHPLLHLENVLLTPHIAGIDTLSVRHMAEKAARVAVDLYQGRWPAECIVNNELGRRGWKW